MPSYIYKFMHIHIYRTAASEASRTATDKPDAGPSENQNT